MIALGFLLLLVGVTFTIGVIGGLAGLVLGNLRLPFLLGVLPPATAAGTNVTLSGVSAGAGVLAHLSGGRFDRRVFLLMAPPSIAGALAGGFLSGYVPAGVLILLVAGIVLEQGYELLRSTRASAPERPPGPSVLRDRRWAAGLVFAGVGIGLLGGLVGLILGTIRLPVLLRSGVNVRDAVGTNLAVGFFVGIAGLVGHLVGGTIDLYLALLLTPSAALGGVLGGRWAGRLSERELKRAVGVVLVGVGTILIGFLAAGAIPL